MQHVIEASASNLRSKLLLNQETTLHLFNAAYLHTRTHDSHRVLLLTSRGCAA